MNVTTFTRRQALVIAGTEGGGVTLYGKQVNGRWRYLCSYVDQTPLLLGDDSGREIRREFRWTDSWEDALGMLDQQRWTRFPAIMVHPEFRAAVWQAARERLGTDPANDEKLETWRWRCDVDLESAR